MSYINPTVDEFKAYFDRDFPYGSTLDTVRDSDISKAFTEACTLFNACLWENQSEYTVAIFYLWAHSLVMNLRASTQGVAGQFDWLTTNKAVGNVSEGFQIPQRVLDNPEFAMMSKTPYGAKYLFLLLPRLLGASFPVCGETHA